MLRMVRYLALMIGAGGIAVASGYGDGVVVVLLLYFALGFWFGIAWRPSLGKVRAWFRGSAP